MTANAILIFLLFLFFLFIVVFTSSPVAPAVHNIDQAKFGEKKDVHVLPYPTIEQYG